MRFRARTDARSKRRPHDWRRSSPTDAPWLSEARAGARPRRRTRSLTGLFGEQLVDRFVELGMILDLAHASERSFFGVLERVPAGSAFVSHAGCRLVRATARNLSDDQLRALTEHGGVLCVVAHPLRSIPSRRPWSD
ncbi:MAG: membrane dipeptidase [Actinobacteria bacterium]|nr:membrane dipeptidase [Actinomycetota bacterium]